MESSGMSLAVAWCAQMEKSQRIFSLSSWSMDVSPSRAPMTSTFVETREAHLCVMANLSMHLLSGSTDSLQCGSSVMAYNARAGCAFTRSYEADWLENIFLPFLFCFVFLFFFFGLIFFFWNWEEVNTLERYVSLMFCLSKMPTSNDTYCVKNVSFFVISQMGRQEMLSRFFQSGFVQYATLYLWGQPYQPVTTQGVTAKNVSTSHCLLLLWQIFCLTYPESLLIDSNKNHLLLKLKFNRLHLQK